MNTYASMLTEDAIKAAEEEQGVEFCSSFRKFLLSGKITILNDDDTLPLSIIPVELFLRNYDVVDELTVGPFAIVARK